MNNNTVVIRNYFQMLILFIITFSACKSGSSGHSESNAALPSTEKNNGIQFALKLMPGAKYYYTTTTETNTKVEVNDQKIKTENNATIGLIYEVLPVTGDSTVLKITYDKIHIELTDKGDKQVMDAGNTGEEQSTMDKLLGLVKGSSVFITLDKKGRIIKTSGSKEITDKVLGGLGMYDDGQTKMMVKEQIGKLVGDDFIESNISQGFNFYPDTAVTEGQSWSKKNTSVGDIKLDGVTRYTLSSIDDGIATISIDIHSANNGTNKPIFMMGQQVQADLSQKADGYFEIEMATGMLTRAKSKTVIQGTIQVMTKVVPVEITTKKKLTIKKI
ncbi:MAG: DUF6263 family protein [Ferruginibacter sp.]